MPGPDPHRIEVRAALLGLSTSALCDALAARHGHPAHLAGLVSPTPGRPLSGPAATMLFLPLRRDLVDPARHDFAALVLEAVADDPEGRVLVAATSGHPDAAVAGGMKLSRLWNLGMAGILTDGRLRDFAEIDGLGLAAWCRGEGVRQGGDALMPWQAGGPVAVGGVTVVPGDWVHADAAGAVVIPAADLAGVIEAARAKEAHDAEVVQRMREEDRARRPRPA